MPHTQYNNGQNGIKTYSTQNYFTTYNFSKLLKSDFVLWRLRLSDYFDYPFIVDSNCILDKKANRNSRNDIAIHGYVYNKRKRLGYFYFARDLLYQIRDLGDLERDKLNQLIEIFRAWLREYRDKWIFLFFINEKKDSNTYGYGLFIKAINRYSKRYYRRIAPKLFNLNKIRFDVMVTLTIDPKQFINLGLEFDAITYHLQKVYDFLRKRYKDINYFYVLEIQKSGRPHIHLLVRFNDFSVKSRCNSMDLSVKKQFFKELANGILDRWNIGAIKIRKIRYHGYNSLTVQKYVMKYVTKMNIYDNFNDVINKDVRELMDNENLYYKMLYASLLFSSNKRMFSMDKRLRDMANENVKKSEKLGFVYMGFVSKVELEDYYYYKVWIQLEQYSEIFYYYDIEIYNKIVIDITLSDIYRYPFLFKYLSENDKNDE